MPFRTLALTLLGTSLLVSQPAPDSLLGKLGHSSHGEAFDTGPREKPWVIPGIGVAHFPITTKNPEVQKWFDQGNALLHSFWDYEAERAFRWCLKLEPDNAMAYWGLARAAGIGGMGGPDRPADMIRQAIKYKDKVSPREQLFIDALAAAILPDPLHPDSKRSRKILEKLCVTYPDDMEARAMLALYTLGDDRYGTELILREIEAKLPDHPAVHHYRIHNWDYNQPEQALASAQLYGSIAPGIGHAIHMPGHIFSIVGMWNEAAISMDAATRREKQYMQQRLTFPFNNWNYGHNLNYLCYIQEQMGMADAAIFGAHQLIDAPLDPEGNADQLHSTHSRGIAALARALLKFERWDVLLNEKTIPWRDIVPDKADRAYFEARAYLAKGDIQNFEKRVAAHDALKKDLEKNKEIEEIYDIQARELKGRLALSLGQTLEGLQFLSDAAQREYDFQKGYADPPAYPVSLYNDLGEAYLNTKSPLLAAEAFEKAATLVKNDIFALSGLVRAYAAAGEKAKATAAMSKLLFVTADADQRLPVVTRAMATGITATPKDDSPASQRNYRRMALDEYGPNHWEPYAAPGLSVKDADGKTVTLAECRGKNVILVFYLGEECAHCMKQLHDIGAKKSEWERLNTVVLAVSSALPGKNAESVKAFGDLPVRLLSDDHFVNARRFHSYDDFEEIELHSTILIDRDGHVHWARNGGDPFGDMAFLVKQLERMNAAPRPSGESGGN